MLRVGIESVDGSRSVDVVAMASSEFAELEPEVLLPLSMAERPRLHGVAEPETRAKVAGDCREASLLGNKGSAKVCVLAGDRVEGPVTSAAVVAPGARYAPLNDELLGRLRVFLLDFRDGIWCFRDELGRRERRSLWASAPSRRPCSTVSAFTTARVAGRGCSACPWGRSTLGWSSCLRRASRR